MNKEDSVQLTNNLYRLTLLFPKKEPLRYKMRELADDILANLIKAKTNNPPYKIDKDCSWQIKEDIEVLDGFFEVAKAQNWVNPQEILKMQEEYNKIKELDRAEKEEKIVMPEQLLQKSSLAAKTPLYFSEGTGLEKSSRCKRILEILREKERIQVWEIKKIFPEISKRTLRRDFEQLFHQGLIERIGERNDTFYRLNPVAQQSCDMG